jgi:hypothetical protein
VLRETSFVGMLLLATLVAAPAAAQAADPELFLSGATSSVAEAAAVTANGNPVVRRARSARINEAAIRRICANSAVSINLFPDMTLRVSGGLLQPAAGGKGIEWWAEGPPGTSISFVLATGCTGGAAIAGAVRLPDQRMFSITSAGPGLVVVAEQSSNRQISGSTFRSGRSDIAQVPPGRSPGGRRAKAAVSATPPVIDVLGLYTARAKADYFGDAGVQAHLQLELGDANRAMYNSGVAARFRLVHMAEINYVGIDPVPALTALYYPDDGVMDAAHVLRDRYGADLVTLEIGMRVSGTTIGLGYMPVPPTAQTDTLGLTVVGSVPGAFVLAHELGHNLGLDHDWETEKGMPYVQEYAFNHGAFGRQKNWHTIMTYANACGYCPGIPYFSNPRIKYQGEPLGVVGGSKPADNARMINLTAGVVAAYRPSVVGAVTYPVTVTAGPGGTARAAYPGPYTSGSRVTIIATAKKGHRFTGWTLNGKPYSAKPTASVLITGKSVLTARFQPGADVAVAMSQPHPRQGRNFSYTVTVRNAGPGSATGLIATGSLSRNHVVGRHDFRFNLKPLAAGSRQVIRIKSKVKAYAQGRITFTAHARSSQFDYNSGNNATRRSAEITG